MASELQTASTSKAMLWTGRVISGLIVLMLIFSGVMKILQSPDVVKGFEHLGWPMSVAIGVGIAEIGSTILYAVPQTAVLGAILMTGYLGGAVATHVRIGEHSQIAAPIIIGVLVWLGLYLRDARLRSLIPLRRM